MSIGLNDCTGTPIYEHDIVRVSGPEIEETFEGEVVYYRGYAAYGINKKLFKEILKPNTKLEIINKYNLYGDQQEPTLDDLFKYQESYIDHWLARHTEISYEDLHRRDYLRRKEDKTPQEDQDLEKLLKFMKEAEEKYNNEYFARKHELGTSENCSS